MYCRGYLCTTWNHSSSSTTFLTLRDDMITTCIFTLNGNCCAWLSGTNHLFLHNNGITSIWYRRTSHYTYCMASFDRIFPYNTGTYNTINNILITICFIGNGIPIHGRFRKGWYICRRNNILCQHISFSSLNINHFYFMNLCL